MKKAELEASFDQQAASYDEQWRRLAPLRDALHLLVGAVFADLPTEARVLCVGAGTGVEVIYLAERFPSWRFTAVEPSARMLEVCRRRLEERGLLARCRLHRGYLDSLPLQDGFHAATAFLVSQFIMEPASRTAFFREIAKRLQPGGRFACADLAANRESAAYQNLLADWLEMMKAAGLPQEAIERLPSVYGRDVAVLPPEQVAALIQAGGFDTPTPFFQAGLMRGWRSQRASSEQR